MGFDVRSITNIGREVSGGVQIDRLVVGLGAPLSTDCTVGVMMGWVGNTIPRNNQGACVRLVRV